MCVSKSAQAASLRRAVFQEAPGQARGNPSSNSTVAQERVGITPPR